MVTLSSVPRKYGLLYRTKCVIGTRLAILAPLTSALGLRGCPFGLGNAAIFAQVYADSSQNCNRKVELHVASVSNNSPLLKKPWQSREANRSSPSFCWRYQVTCV